MKGNRVKISLIFAIAAMLMCVAALVGTTFAWFTSSITSGGNTITAGSLSVSATVYSVTSNTPTIDTDLTSGTELSNKQFAGANSSNAYYIVEVKNTGTINAAINLSAGELTNVSIAQYSTNASQITVGTATNYYKVESGSTIYFLLTDTQTNSNIYTVTVNACNIIETTNSYTSGGFTYKITSGS